jgi:hypothetical protein
LTARLYSAQGHRSEAFGDRYICVKGFGNTQRGGNMPGIWKVKGLFFLAAGISFLLSVYLWFNGQKDQGVFVGVWVPSILSSGALLLAGTGRRHE